MKTIIASVLLMLTSSLSDMMAIGSGASGLIAILTVTAKKGKPGWLLPRNILL
jgi:hypothetical protein